MNNLKLFVSKWTHAVVSNELIKGSFSVFFIRMTGMVISYFFYVLISRYFGSSGMGIFSLTVTILLAAVIPALLGLDSYFLKTVSQNNAKGEEQIINSTYIQSWIIIFISSLLASCVLILIKNILAENIFKIPELKVSLIWVSFLLFPVALFLFHVEGFRGLKMMGLYGFFSSVSRPLFGIIILLYFIFFIPFNLYSPLYAYVLSIGVGVIFIILTWFYVYRKFTFSLKFNKTFSEILSVSIPLFLSSTIFYVLQWTDLIMLGIFKTTEDVGLYTVVIKIVMLSRVSLIAVHSISAPKFAEAYSKKDHNKLSNLAKFSTRLLLWTMGPLILLMIVFSEFLLGVFGSEFVTAKMALLVLLIGQVFNAWCGPVVLLFQMTNGEKLVKNVMIVSAFMNIAFNILMIPKFGILGAALASSLTTAGWNVYLSVQIKKRMGFSMVLLPGFLH